MSEEEINKIVKENYGFSVEEIDNTVGNLSLKINQLEDRINKAVEYIEDKLKIYPEGLATRHLGQEFLKDILDLLKGDKEYENNEYL